VTEQVHRHDGLGLLGDRGLDRCRVQAEVRRLDVGDGEWKCPSTGEMYIETDGRLRPAEEDMEEN